MMTFGMAVGAEFDWAFYKGFRLHYYTLCAEPWKPFDMIKV